MRVPPGVNAADFADALAGFRAVVGADWVFTSDEDLEPYRDAYSILWQEDEEKIASAAVAPFTAEEVQAVVRIANQFKVPIYPISTGKNLGYGGAAPVLSGSVVLDLKRMNRILEIDDATPMCWSSPASPISISTATSRTRAEAVDRLPRSRLGQRHRQCAGLRRRLHPRRLPQPLRLPLRHGGGAGLGRGDAHRHGRPAGLGDLAAEQIRLRALGGRPVQAVQPRRRHQDGVLALSGAGGLRRRPAARAEEGRHQQAGRHHQLPREHGDHAGDAGARQPVPADGRLAGAAAHARHADLRLQRRGAGGLCRRQGHAVLERHHLVLRTGRGGEGPVGVRQAQDRRGDPGRPPSPAAMSWPCP